jgi:hypothetical protein
MLASILKRLNLFDGRLKSLDLKLKNMQSRLERLESVLASQSRAHVIEFFINYEGRRKKVVNMFMKKDEILDLSLGFRDKNGDSAKVDGVPAWALTDESLGKSNASEAVEINTKRGNDPLKDGPHNHKAKRNINLTDGVKHTN